MEQDKLKAMKKELIKENHLAVQKGLSRIYSNKDGSLPDISHLEVRRRGRWKMFLVGTAVILLLLAAISWLGFIVFNPDYQFNDTSIEMNVVSAQNIASGDEVTYTLNYKNLEKVGLDNIEIILRYPDGFEFIESDPAPTNEFNTVWRIGNLARGQKGKIQIKGKLIGEVGSIKTLNATVSFQPENFSSVFKETSSFSSQVTSSILEINIEGPEKVLVEKKAVYKIRYRNSSNQDLHNIKILTVYPPNFIFQEAEPTSYHDETDARNLNNQWLLTNLGKNEEGEIEITGGYLAQEGSQEANFNVQIGFLEDETKNFSLQQEKSAKTKVISQKMSVNLIAGGSSQNQPISFGQNLLYSIVYKNLGQEELDDVEFTITLDSDVLDWETLEDKNSGVIKDNTITWNKDQISELDLLRPLDEGTIDFSIQVKEADSIDLDNTSLQTKNKVEAKMANIDELATEDLKIESNEIVNNINTDIQLKVEGRYFDDDNIAVGTGPLPPVVGQTTSFRIYWYIANSLHDVENVTIKTTLPQGVQWADKYLIKTGTIVYSAQDNSITWSISQISPNKGFDEVSAWFDVSVTPTKQQERKLLILTDQTSLIATDKVTESDVSKIGKAITSNLEDDPVGGGRGLVIDISE